MFNDKNLINVEIIFGDLYNFLSNKISSHKILIVTSKNFLKEV